MSSPNLVAPGVKSFMDFTLKNCKNMKETYTTIGINISLGLGLITVIGLFLYYKYKGKITPEEKEQKKREGQNYVMRKLGMHVATKQINQNNNSNSLTGLPMWDKSLLIPGIGK